MALIEGTIYPNALIPPCLIELEKTGYLQPMLERRVIIYLRGKWGEAGLHDKFCRATAASCISESMSIFSSVSCPSAPSPCFLRLQAARV